MPDWTFCPKCASTLTPGAPTCPGCGAVLSEFTLSSDGSARTEPADLAAAIEDELRETLAPGLLLLKPIGHGGMGTVYLARDPALKRNVVVKVLAPWLANDATARARFEREAQSAAAVAHPNVVSVFQVGTLPRSATSYFVMQHVDGDTLENLFPEGTRVAEPRVRQLVGQIAAALAAGHARGVVHRDVKPANVMVERGSDRVVVLDFGISAAATPGHRARSTRLTEQGTSIGTPQYMSPEQAASEEVTDRSDIYSLGLVAFELLTGHAPFDEPNAMALIAAHINKAPPKVAASAPGVDPAVATLIDQCLAKDPDARPSAEAVARALLPGAHQLIEWPPPGTESLVATGSLGLWVSMVCVVAAGFMVGWDEASGAVWTIGVTALVGAFAAFIVLEMRFERRFLPLWKSGYSAKVLLDVMLDRSPDTRMLLNAAGPYATLTMGERTRLMTRRRCAAGVMTLGFLLSMVLAIQASSRSAAASGVPLGRGLVVMLPFFLALLAARQLLRRERLIRRRAGGTRLRGTFTKAPPVKFMVDDWMERTGNRLSAARRSVWRFRATKWVFYPIVDLAAGVLIVVFVFVLAIPAALIDRTSADPMASELGLHRASDRLGDRLVAELVPGRRDKFDSTLLASVPLVDSTVQHPHADTLWQAIARAPVDSAVAAAVRRYAGQPEAAWWQRVVQADALPAFWYLPADMPLESDTLRDAVGRGRHALRDGGRFLASAAIVAFLAGDTATALARARDVVWLGALTSHEPYGPFELDVATVFETASYLLDSLGQHGADTVLVRQARALHDAALARRSSYGRLRFGWAARLANLDDAAPQEIGLWRAVIADERERLSHRWLAYETMSLGLCFNRWESFRGASETRAALLAEADSVLAGMPRLDIWKLRAGRVTSGARSGANRFGYCIGTRAAYRRPAP